MIVGGPQDAILLKLGMLLSLVNKHSPALSLRFGISPYGLWCKIALWSSGR